MSCIPRTLAGFTLQTNYSYIFQLLKENSIIWNIDLNKGIMYDDCGKKYFLKNIKNRREKNQTFYLEFYGYKTFIDIDYDYTKNQALVLLYRKRLFRKKQLLSTEKCCMVPLHLILGYYTE